MARYFLHLRVRLGPDGLIKDPEGDEVDPEHLREHVRDTARDLILIARIGAIPNWFECSFEVTDSADVLVLTFAFSEMSE